MRTTQHFSRLVTAYLLLMLAYGSSLHAAAQEPGNDTVTGLASQTWEQQYRACFDPQDRPVPERMRTFVAIAEARRAALSGTSPTVETLALLNTLARAYGNLHEWNQAEASDLTSLSILNELRNRRKDDPHLQAEAAWYDWHGEQANRNLAGVYGTQRRWTAATRYYLWWVWLAVMHNYVPFVAVA